MRFPDPPKSCCACETDSAPVPIEKHRDPVAGKEYRLLRCLACGVVFSEPRVAVSGDWYAAAAPLRLEAFSGDPERDWRFLTFFRDARARGKVLDIGCGDGGFLLSARARGWRVAGFDYDERVAAEARRKGLKDVSSSEFLPFMRSRADAEFDAAVLFDVLEHTPEPLRFLQEVRRVIRPGGLLAVTLPNAARPLPWGREAHDYPPHHFTRWTPEALGFFLSRNGFEVLRLEASRLPVYYLAEHLFYHALMPRLLPLAKRLLFGARAKQGTVTELYSAEGGRGGNPALREALKGPAARHRAALFLKRLLAPALYPVAAALALGYRIARPHCGEHLYALARRPPLV